MEGLWMSPGLLDSLGVGVVEVTSVTLLTECLELCKCSCDPLCDPLCHSPPLQIEMCWGEGATGQFWEVICISHSDLYTLSAILAQAPKETNALEKAKSRQ